jgi:hypothetical protein
MGPLDLLNHLLNFVAPAVWMAVLVTLAARLFMKKRPVAPGLRVQVAINFIVCVVVLVLGLWAFGRDGKMATYLGMALACASAQWAQLGLWRLNTP